MFHSHLTLKIGILIVVLIWMYNHDYFHFDQWILHCWTLIIPNFFCVTFVEQLYDSLSINTHTPLTPIPWDPSVTFFSLTTSTAMSVRFL
uniref:Uncharacterized protein n=1 Tax=Pararge aegeria TaxID=116150 RepID=S4PJA2_9NEOP